MLSPSGHRIPSWAGRSPIPGVLQAGRSGVYNNVGHVTALAPVIANDILYIGTKSGGVEAFAAR
ncbi:MAG TPA: hypothetical protein VMI73_11600 [Trebonia sp.]|nr:hypothetical protein [Trebonia sp.]